jgi:hypothetical protein
MFSKIWRPAVIPALTILLAAAPAHAQQQTAAVAAVPEFSKWTLDFGVGWDNGVSGNINSSGIGQINGQAAVVTANTYEDVYGTGLHLRGGGGYALSEVTEVIGYFTFQSLDADQVVPMGDIGVSNLYGKYTDYQTLAFDVGLRRYLPVATNVKAYGDGLIGVGFVDKTDVQLVAPGANLEGFASDFYDQTSALSMGANVGMLYQTAGRMGFYGQLGLRWMSGMDEIDDLEDNGLGDINDKSSRWTMPFVAGVRVRF